MRWASGVTNVFIGGYTMATNYGWSLGIPGLSLKLSSAVQTNEDIRPELNKAWQRLQNGTSGRPMVFPCTNEIYRRFDVVSNRFLILTMARSEWDRDTNTILIESRKLGTIEVRGAEVVTLLTNRIELSTFIATP